MTIAYKSRLLLMLGLGLLVMFGLAAALKQVDLHPGKPFSLGYYALPNVEETPNLPRGNIFILFLRGLLILAMVLTIFYIFINLLTPEGRKRLLADLVVLGLLLFMVNLLSLWHKGEVAQQDSQAPGISQPPLQFPSEEATDRFQPTQSSWIRLIIGLIFAVILSVLLAAVLWMIYRRKRMKISTLERLGEQAREAVNSLLDGVDFNKTIIRIYIQMSQVLHEERGISREAAMTAHEFQNLLYRKGFPEEPVKNITDLFERVRYGNWQPRGQDEQQAIESLNQISIFCAKPNNFLET